MGSDGARLLSSSLDGGFKSAFHLSQMGEGGQKSDPDFPEQVEEPAVVYGITHSRRPRNPRAQGFGSGELVRRIQHGLAMGEFFALQELLGTSGEELAEHLGISRSTLARRKRSGRLATDESDRLVRYTRLFARAEEVVGEGDAARAWFRTPLRALDFTAPIAYAATEAGAREIENLLGRIEHGVFS